MKLPEEQRKAIEQEAEELWPERLFPSGAQRRAYAHGATTRAIICQQKDEEIGRLKEIIIFYDHPDADVEFAARQWATVHEKDEEIARLRKALGRIEQYSDSGSYATAIVEMKVIATEALKPIANDQNAKTGSIQ